MIQTLSRVGIGRSYPNKIKAIYETLSANIILNGQKLRFSFKSKNKTRMSTFTTRIQHSTRSSRHSEEEEIKGLQILKEEIKLFEDDMLFYIENPIGSTIISPNK